MLHSATRRLEWGWTVAWITAEYTCGKLRSEHEIHSLCDSGIYGVTAQILALVFVSITDLICGTTKLDGVHMSMNAALLFGHVSMICRKGCAALSRSLNSQLPAYAVFSIFPAQ
jgi:hypothetical protein